jgi:hypothetical protein
LSSNLPHLHGIAHANADHLTPAHTIDNDDEEPAVNSSALENPSGQTTDSSVQ